jgi:predicted GNAT family N-acyltransferase
MEIRIIQYGSNDYEQMIKLRISQLLEPIGVSASYIEREKEGSDFLLGAFENDELIGCCILTPQNNSVVQLRQMAVRSDYRGKGIGAAIIMFAEKVAKQNHFSTLLMHARDPVIEFYKKCGYEISGDRFFEVGIGHHKMMKRLS